MESNYGTPMSSVKSPTKTPRNRRRAISPKTGNTTPRSPFSFVDLEAADRETLKTKLIETQELLQEAREESERMHENMISEAGLDDSIIVETSNRVSTQQTRIYTRDRLVLEDELKKKQAFIGKLQTRVTELESANRKLLEDLQSKHRKWEDAESNTQSTLENLQKVEDEVRSKDLLMNQMKSEMEDQVREIKEKANTFEANIKAMERKLELAGRNLEQERHEKIAQSAKCQRLEQQIAKLEKELNDDQKESAIRRSLEAENEQIAETRRVLSEVQQLSSKVQCLTPVRAPSVSKLRENDEFLRMSAKLIEENISDLKRRNGRLEKEVGEKKEALMKADAELVQLREQLKVVMGDHDQANRFLQDENAKLTLQKADIRCELIEAKRQLAQCQRNVETMEAEKQNNAENLEKLKKLEEEMEEAHKREEELEQSVILMTSMRRQNDDLKAEITKMQERMAMIKDALVVSDQQCTKLTSLREAAEKSRGRAIEQCNEMVAKIRNLEASLENQRKVEQELEMLRADNERQKTKIQFLNEEIQETHADYRQELSKLAIEKAQKKETNEDYSQLVSELKLTISQRESALRSAKKQTDEVRDDNAKLAQQLADVRTQQSLIVEENAKLRKGLADAVAKIEEYKRECENSREMAQRMAEELGESQIRLSKMEEELSEKQQQVSESEQVVNYLHSQINLKPTKQPKLGRRSTLLSTVSESVLDTSAFSRESEEVLRLEDTKRELLRTLEEKRRMVEERVAETSTSSTTTNIISKSVTTVSTVPQNKSSSSKSASELARPATMRHDIPHKWKEVRHLSVLSLKCAICFVGISTFGKAKKCAHCDVQVHAACASKVFNTCGMPAECANYYRENHTTVSSSGIAEGRMNGWLNVYRDDQPSSQWISSWAMMDLSRIAFYTNDGADLDKPFFTIDLNREQWVLRAGMEMPIESPDHQMRASNVLQIKMTRRNIYLLAPSQNSARRWSECLQVAQRKRMMLTSRPSSMAEYTCLLVLNSPNNLRIYKSYCFDDWILFATQTGLFYTSISQPRNPVRIAGPNSVTCMEMMTEINCIAIISNTTGQLALIPMESLTLAMQSTQPAIRPDTLPEFQHCGIIKYHQQNGQRFLIVGDATSISILRYNVSRDVFCSFARHSVAEPVVAIESAHNGIYFAADTFYYVNLESSVKAQKTPRQLVTPNDTDYPISVVTISDNELLLAYQNYGIFVDSRNGTLSRRDPIEWEQMPTEFAYIAPHLFVIHYDSIVILEIAENTGIDSKAFAADRELFECVNAHVIGRQMDSVLISVSSRDATEVHRFNLSGTKRNVTKRRGISPIDTMKRHKNGGK